MRIQSILGQLKAGVRHSVAGRHRRAMAAMQLAYLWHVTSPTAGVL